ERDDAKRRLCSFQTWWGVFLKLCLQDCAGGREGAGRQGRGRPQELPKTWATEVKHWSESGVRHLRWLCAQRGAGKKAARAGRGRVCTDCSDEYTLSVKHRRGNAVRFNWRGPRYDCGCDTCNGDEVSAVKGTILAGTPTSLWMNKLSAFVMWCFDYSLGTLKDEEHMARKMDSGSIFADLLGGGPRKRPAAAKAAPKCRAKRSAKSRPAQAGVKKRPVMKRPARSRLPVARTRKVILQVDESFLNKGKLSKLAKNARPKKDKLWLWGAVVQGSPHLFFFKVLKSVEDAYDGKPRGKQELLENFKELSPPAGVVIVSDKWRGAIAAVK
ncbi:unnamed protein product, partial [Prorocentrum cordatum]